MTGCIFSWKCLTWVDCHEYVDDTLERFDELAEDVFDEDSLGGFIPASVMSNECCMTITIDISTSSFLPSGFESGHMAELLRE